MTDLGDHDPFDPVIAERFRLLEQIQPPADVLNRPSVVPLSPVASPTPMPRGPRSPRRLAVLAAAAALAVAAGSAVALTGLGRGNGEIRTVDPAVESDSTYTSGQPTGEDDARVLAIEAAGDGQTATGATAPGAGEADSQTDSGESSEPTAPGTEDERDPDQTASSTERTTSTTSSATETTSGGSATTPSTTTTTTTSTTAGTAPTPSGSVNPGKDVMLTIRGLVTEVFTDCVSHQRLSPEGNVIDVGAVSCDGGSWIVVDGTRVQTSSGFVADDLPFDRHDPTLRPGRTAVVTAISPAGAAKVSLNCPVCRIEES